MVECAKCADGLEKPCAYTRRASCCVAERVEFGSGRRRRVEPAG